MNIRKRAPVMGNFITDFIGGILSPRTGQIIEVPGAPAALSMNVVGVLFGAVVLAAVLKQKRVI